MKPKEKQSIEEPKELQVIEAQALDKPEHDTKFAQESARLLVDIIKKNNWSRKLGGQSEHIQYEGWQTAGKYYGYSVKTYDSEYVEYGGTWGFKAKATVVNEKTGIEIGGAEALCMSDEINWKSKPKFQLASMAQTRAGSKALRQILGFVVALAGYNPTPAEEMIAEEPKAPLNPKEMRQEIQDTENSVPSDDHICPTHEVQMKLRSDRNNPDLTWYDHRKEENGIWYACTGKGVWKENKF